MKILVSSCLMGVPCRYDGKPCSCEAVMGLKDKGHELVAMCPELLAGLKAPRLPCEIDAGCREARVLSQDGTNLTEAFELGARRAVEIARVYDCKLAILKSKSPSCGSDHVYDGSFSGTLIPGAGMATRRLREEGVRVVSEQRVESCTSALFATSSEDTPTLSTERLVLRPITQDDAEAIFEYSKNPAVGPDAGWAPHRSIDDTHTFIDQILSQPHVFGIEERATGRDIGSVGLITDAFRKNTDCLMLGYALGQPWWGKGYMTEAVREIIRYGFEDLGLSLITVNHYLFNTRSKRVIEKSGFTREGVLRGVEATPDGIMQDAVSYSLTKEEYFSLRATKG